MQKRVIIGSDHGGFELKDKVKSILVKKDFIVFDVGCNSLESCDYPDFGALVAKGVASKDYDNGIAICTTGIGMSMVTNKVCGVRAGLCHNKEAAILTRAHNDANVLVLGSKFVKDEDLNDVVSSFFDTEFEGGRHLRRVNKIDGKGE